MVFVLRGRLAISGLAALFGLCGLLGCGGGDSAANGGGSGTAGSTGLGGGTAGAGTAGAGGQPGGAGGGGRGGGNGGSAGGSGGGAGGAGGGSGGAGGGSGGAGGASNGGMAGKYTGGAGGDTTGGRGGSIGSAGRGGSAGQIGSGGGSSGAGGVASGGNAGSGTFAVPLVGLPDLTFYGCDGNSIVGSASDHGVVFTMGAADLQPTLPFATTPILRGTSSAGSVGDGGTIFPGKSTVTSADLFASFSTYYTMRVPYNFFVGANGTILNGNALVASPTTKDLHAITGLLNYIGDAWAVGADATIIRWEAQQWQPGTHPAEPGITLRGVSEAAPGDAWAVGDAGHALHWDGTSWTAVATGTSVNLNAIVHLPVQSGIITAFYAVGDAGTILKWDGFTWTAVASPTMAPLYAVCLSPQGLTVGGQGGAYSTPLGGVQWAPYALDLGVPSATPAIGAVSATDVWAAFSAANTSRILHFDGNAWTTVAFLKYPAVSRILVGPGGTVWFYGPAGGEQWKGGTFQQSYSLYGSGPAAAAADNDVWLVVDNGSGAVARSNGTNPGASPAGPPNAVVVDITATTPSDVWAITEAELWRWDGSAWALHPISMPMGDVGAFQHVRETPSGVWILAQNALLKWTGTVLTQWSLPTAVTATPTPAGQIHFIPLRDDAIWLAGPWGAFRWDGSQWAERAGDGILDLSGDATRIWAVTPTAILDFTP